MTAISDYYKKKREVIQNERIRLATERAKSGIAKLLETEQFKMSVLAMDDANLAVDTLINTAINACLDPKSEFNDTLRSRGFRPAEIRALVRDLYTLYACFNNPDKANDVLYEEKLEFVANYVREHQELYSTFDPENLRHNQLK